MILLMIFSQKNLWCRATTVRTSAQLQHILLLSALPVDPKSNVS